MAVTAIVTGGASGIGRALVAELAGRGATVVVADIDGDAASAVAEEGAAAPGSLEATQVDVADGPAVEDLVLATHARHGRLDYLFNNAGIGAALPFEQAGADRWRRMVEVNLESVIHGSRSAYPLMVEQGFGRIVNTASLAGLLGGLGVAVPYATTKHGIVGFSLALRVAAAAHGVGVHVVCPGGIDTPLLDKTRFPGLPVPEEAAVRSMRAYSADVGVRRFYPAERLARDVLRGIDKDRALIVAPFSARLTWRMWRLAPERMLRLSVAATRWQARRAARNA